MFRRFLVLLAVLVSVFGFNNNSFAEPKFTDVSTNGWGDTQFGLGLELRRPVAHTPWTITVNGLKFDIPQSKVSNTFYWVGAEHQTTTSLWLSPQLGMVTNWKDADKDSPIVGLWTGWESNNLVDGKQVVIELTTDTEGIFGGGRHDFFGHYEANLKFKNLKLGPHFEQVNEYQQYGYHVQLRGQQMKATAGIYLGSGGANFRAGFNYTLPL
jgi:hypothetical protein